MDSKQSINLFIDANIWLLLFHFTNDDLEQFRKLKDYIGNGIRLYVPEQIKNEVLRNRESKIKDALDKFEEFRLPYPAYAKKYTEYDQFDSQFQSLRALHREWVKRIKQDVIDGNLPADVALREVFDCVEIIPTTQELVQKGVMRYNIGNPPGKDKKYGDAINWETLLDSVPDGEDLHFVSMDKDYSSVFDKESFHPFLSQEWEEKKHSKIIFFKSLDDFFKKNVSDIQLYSERAKDNLINELISSRSFQTTHRVIRDLAQKTGWSFAQIQDICKAALDNQQVHWVLADQDVFDFYDQLLDDELVGTSDDESVHKVKKELLRIKKEKTPSRWLY